MKKIHLTENELERMIFRIIEQIQTDFRQNSADSGAQAGREGWKYETTGGVVPDTTTSNSAMMRNYKSQPQPIQNASNPKTDRLKNIANTIRSLYVKNGQLVVRSHSSNLNNLPFQQYKNAYRVSDADIRSAVNMLNSFGIKIAPWFLSPQPGFTPKEGTPLDPTFLNAFKSQPVRQQQASTHRKPYQASRYSRSPKGYEYLKSPYEYQRIPGRDEYQE